MDTKSHVYSLVFFFIDFYCALIEISFALPRLDRRSPSFIFDLPLSEGNFNFFFFLIAFLKIFLYAPSLCVFF